MSERNNRQTVFNIPLLWPIRLLQNCLYCPLIGEKKKAK